MSKFNLSNDKMSEKDILSKTTKCSNYNCWATNCRKRQNAAKDKMWKMTKRQDVADDKVPNDKITIYQYEHPVSELI
jgi:hypothetical protein